MVVKALDKQGNEVLMFDPSAVTSIKKIWTTPRPASESLGRLGRGNEGCESFKIRMGMIWTTSSTRMGK
jgi:hypothetical protein